MVKEPSVRFRYRFASFVMATTVTAGCASGPQAGGTRQSEQSTPASATDLPRELIRTAGTVVDGTEPGCLLLDNGIRRYHLVGGAEAGLEPGQEVTVTGLADPNTTSTCEQTTPLTIDKVEPAE